jgi:hypothetical protein
VRVVAVITALVIATTSSAACSSNGGNTKAFCDALRAGENPLDVFDRYDPTNVSTAREQLQRGVDRLRELERAAPSEIRDDLQVLVDVGNKVVEALDPATGGRPPPDFTADFQRVQDASGRVTEFASTQCGVDLDSASPGPAATPSG